MRSKIVLGAYHRFLLDSIFLRVTNICTADTKSLIEVNAFLYFLGKTYWDHQNINFCNKRTIESTLTTTKKQPNRGKGNETNETQQNMTTENIHFLVKIMSVLDLKISSHHHELHQRLWDFPVISQIIRLVNIQATLCYIPAGKEGCLYAQTVDISLLDPAVDVRLHSNHLIAKAVLWSFMRSMKFWRKQKPAVSSRASGKHFLYYLKGPLACSLPEEYFIFTSKCLKNGILLSIIHFTS